VHPHAATYPVALDHSSLQRWAPVLPRVPWPEPCLSAEVDSGAAMCPTTPNLASIPRWAPALPCVPWCQTSPPWWGELWCCHMSLSSRPRFPAEVGSSASTCPMAPGSASSRGELRCCHVYHGPQRAMDYRNKESLACFQGTLVCYRGICKTCGQPAIVWLNSATPAQLTTPGHGYSGDTTQQDGTRALPMFNTVGWWDMMPPCCWHRARHH
jgi:hypothetical protein